MNSLASESSGSSKERRTTENHHPDPSRQIFLFIPVLKITRGTFTLPNSIKHNVFFIAEVCRLNIIISECLRIIRTMIKCTYFLISFCRLNTHSTLIITEPTGSTYAPCGHDWLSGRGGQWSYILVPHHISIDLLRAISETSQTNNLHPIGKDKPWEDK